MIVGFINLLV